MIIVHCDKCKAVRPDAKDAAKWVTVSISNKFVADLCPDCELKLRDYLSKEEL